MITNLQGPLLLRKCALLALHVDIGMSAFPPLMGAERTSLNDCRPKAAQAGLSPEALAKAGMAQMLKKFRQMSGEIYVDQAAAVKVVK
jgi:hypothetical protein